MTLIGIIVKNEEDAYTIFETLNDRGLRLSVPDLVLNLLMRRARNDKERSIVRQHWNSMLRELGRRDVSRFLRHLWVSHYGDLKSEGLFVAIRRELDSKKMSSVAFAELCADECDDYITILDVNIPLASNGLRNLEGIIKYLQITAAPPLLLAAYRSLSTQDFEKLLQAIIATHVRYVVITNQNPLDIESRMYEAARIIRGFPKEKSSSQKLAAAKAKLRELTVLDSTVKDASDCVYLERSEAIWLMTALANDLQSKTREIRMDKSNLEHIFPQNAMPTEWTKATEMESLVWHIGNLTILGERINRKAQNKGFLEKSSQYYSKSEIKMTQEILSYSSWTSKEVLSRANKLVTQVLKVWPAI